MSAYYFACANHSILDASGDAWAPQRRSMHPWVREVGAAMCRLADERPIGSGPIRTPFRVRLWDWVGAHVAQLSSDATGLPRLPVRQVWSRLIGWIVASHLVGDVWRPIARWSYSRWTYERRLRAALATPVTPALRAAVQAAGGAGAFLGQAYAVTLGSTIPETTIITDIVSELACDATLQDAVRRAAAGEDASALDFDAFVLERCHRYAFFPSGKLRRIGRRNYSVDYHDPHAGAGPWGYGRRRCPGAAFGERLVRTLVRQIVSAYRLRAVMAPPPSIVSINPKAILARLVTGSAMIGMEHVVGSAMTWGAAAPSGMVVLTPLKQQQQQQQHGAEARCL